MKPVPKFAHSQLKIQLCSCWTVYKLRKKQSNVLLKIWVSQIMKSCWQLLMNQPYASVGQEAQHLICQCLGAQHFPISTEVRIPRNMSYVLSVLLPQRTCCITETGYRHHKTTHVPEEGGKEEEEEEEARFTSLNKAKQVCPVFCSLTIKPASF